MLKKENHWMTSIFFLRNGKLRITGFLFTRWLQAKDIGSLGFKSSFPLTSCVSLRQFLKFPTKLKRKRDKINSILFPVSYPGILSVLFLFILLCTLD